MIYLIITVLTINVILLYIVVNLLLKVEKLEDIIEEKDLYISNMSSIIDESSKRIKSIDERELFSSDDEVGFFFKNIKIIQEYLDKWRGLNDSTVSPSVKEQEQVTYTFTSIQDLLNFVADVETSYNSDKLLFILRELKVENMYTDWSKLPVTSKTQILNNWINLKTSSLNLETSK